MRKNNKLYNVIFPIWLLVWFPSYLWFILIPINYLIDSCVLYFSLPKEDDRKAFTIRHSWKLCIVGFLADLIGSIFLFLINIIYDALPIPFLEKIVDGVMMNPFSNVFSFLYVCIGILISAICIYYFDRWILKKTNLSKAQIEKSARYLAIITAPYLFLLPTIWLYH